MKIYAENGCYLGKIDYINGNLTYFPNTHMTEYMLEETLRIIKKIKR